MAKEEKWFQDNFVKPIEEERYQTRLDKVLSKFEMSDEGYKVLKHKGEILLSYIHLEFVWYINDTHYLSLDTVENLIKDLEGNQ